MTCEPVDASSVDQDTRQTAKGCEIREREIGEMRQVLVRHEFG